MKCILCQYAVNVLLGLDVLASAVIGGDGRETISERMARAQKAGVVWAGRLCRLLDVFGAKHCSKSLEPGSIGRELWDWSKSGGKPTP